MAHSAVTSCSLLLAIMTHACVRIGTRRLAHTHTHTHTHTYEHRHTLAQAHQLIPARESMKDQSVNLPKPNLVSQSLLGLLTDVWVRVLIESGRHKSICITKSTPTWVLIFKSCNPGVWCMEFRRFNKLEYCLWGTYCLVSPSPPEFYCFFTLDRGLLDSC